MIIVSNVALQFGKRVLFNDVNLKFTQGNCYGIIGANGAGKSTFLKILSGEIEPNKGEVIISPGHRMSVLSQDHFAYDQYPVLQTVVMGNKKLWNIMAEKEVLYNKAENLTDADGIRLGDLESEFAEMNGWDAESDAGKLLGNLGIPEDLHFKQMAELSSNEKIRILLAQALFGNPEILLMDEPTNGLDIDTVLWLENFLANYENIVVVVSHDRHFLDTVCTSIVDVDYSKIKMYTGNYTFWYEASQLALKQRQDVNKKTEDKRKELLDFITRFSANAAKSKQATSRKKLLEKLNIDDIEASTRKYPAIIFKPERECGDQILTVTNLSSTSEDGTVLFKNVSFTINKGDKIAIISRDTFAVSRFFDIVNGQKEPDGGEYQWGVTITPAYLPHDNSDFFQSKDNLIDWLRQFSTDNTETFIRGFLGKMLFSGEESLKGSNVLSGGEKVRCMIAKMMLTSPNVLMLDEPTDHLDLESITSFNNSLTDYKGILLFSSRDRHFTETIANRIIEITPNGVIDRITNFEQYIDSNDIKELKTKLYADTHFTHS